MPRNRLSVRLPPVEGARRWRMLTCTKCKSSIRWFGTNAEPRPQHRCAKTRTILPFNREVEFPAGGS